MKTAFSTLAAFALASFAALAAPVDLGAAASRTPYDPYMSPVKHVLDSLGQAKVSMDRAEDLMRQGRGFRYIHNTPYQPALPTETAARRAGDCKDKALWLCDQLHDPSARFVIGKAKRDADVSHAWVMWENQGRWWILDCTLNSRPIPADRVGAGNYVPLYSYGKNATYRHTGSASLTASTAVANAPVVAQNGHR